MNVFAIVDISTLKEHEEVDPKRLKELKKKIESDGVLRMPIVIDRGSNIIIDGHHRFAAIKELGYKKIPAVFIDYSTPRVIVRSWRKNCRVTKEMIIKAGLRGKKLPPKTSKHMIVTKGKIKHISILERKINTPLGRLK